MSDYLPPEVIEQILSRVPVQSLVRFRCVCKLWLSLISSPKFITMTANNGQKLLLFRYFSQITRKDEYIFRIDNPTFDEYASTECPFKSRSFHYRLVGTCNGLICLCDDPYVSGSETVVLWNHAIGKAVKLPSPSIDLPMAALGFGFDPKSNDFKVVRLACKRVVGRAIPPMVEVYSVRSGSWRVISSGWGSDYGIVEDLWSPVFLNGSVHWLGYKSADRSSEGGPYLIASLDSAEKFFKFQSYRSTPEDGFNNVVLSFDLAEEEFRVIEIPGVLADIFPLDLSLGLYGDSLALFQYDVRLNCKSSQCIVMKEYGVVESWSCRSRVKAEEGIWTIFGFKDGGDILFATADNRIISCSPEKGCTTLGSPGFKGSLYAGSFVETLALLDIKENNGLDGLLKSGEEAASEADSEDKNNQDEEFFKRLNYRHFRIAASLIGAHPLD